MVHFARNFDAAGDAHWTHHLASVVTIGYLIYVLLLCVWHWDAQAVVSARVGAIFLAVYFMPDAENVATKRAVQRLAARVAALENQ